MFKSKIVQKSHQTCKWLLKLTVTGYTIFSKWSVTELSGFCIILENDSMDLCQFFSGFRRKHLFI